MKVRVAVAIDPSGQWNACGWGSPSQQIPDDELRGLARDTVGDGERIYWLEADLPIADEPVVTVVPKEDAP